MATYRIGVLNGDDIGLEIVPVAVRVLKTALARHPEAEVEWVPLPIGYLSFIEHGKIAAAGSARHALYARWMDSRPDWPYGLSPRIPNASIRIQSFARSMILSATSARPRHIRASKCINPQTDLIIVRENNEGFQPDRNMYMGTSDCMPTPDMALSLRVVTRRNSSMAARTAFELARQRGGKKKVTAVHKNTVFKLGCGLFMDSCREVAKEYPDIELESCIVDTFAMRMLMNPAQYDVVVTTNMFGDILSDEAAGLVGGLGMAPGLCVGPDYAMAQATHGSAPDIAGKNIANPFAMIESARMLLDWARP